ncbi:MAG TPA: HAMP domain-containing sensor histidine kinase [Candidatus Baltobacterales bacterium]|nr:HAMP domain-containing sensor histidine kinase [Candidatus Baltobacterales bacterium]
MAFGVISRSPLRSAPSTHAVLGAGYAVLVASVAIGSWLGWRDTTTGGLVELGTAVLWLAAFRHWSRSGDAETRRFWLLTGWAALAVAGYGVAGGLADLTGTRWLGVIAALCVMAGAPLMVAGMVSRSSRQEGRGAGASTLLDVGIVVLSTGGLLGPSLIGPEVHSGDPRLITLGGVWLMLLFGLGVYLLLAYRIPVDRSPAGLLLMSGMLAIFTVAGFAGAVEVTRGEALPPWWVDVIYGVGILLGLQAPRFDVRLEVASASLSASGLWGSARMLLPYFAFVPLMVATLFAVLAMPGNDIAKSLAVTLVVVSAVVAARQMLQVTMNRRLVAETAALLKSSQENEAKIAQLSKTKSEVMSNLSHEFRNALVGIQGFSEMMRDQDLPPGEVKEFAADIFNDSNRLTRMITEMLDLDRMESGRVALDLKPLDLNGLVEQAVDRAKVSGAKCEIVCSLQEPLPVVDGDTDRLFQVISNLLGNAVKYSPDGGEVLVTTSQVDGEVRVSVKDHGIGIAPEDLPRLFQRYERIDSKTGSKISGTGLGLVISRQIVEMHGGRIWAGGNEGGGSEFAFAIPIAVRTEPSKGAARSVSKAA